MSKITYNGQTYDTQNDHAFLSNRVFPGWWGDVEQGEEYTSEWYQPAIDSDGEDVKLVYHFTAVKGSEPEDDSDWPWDVDHIVNVK